MTVMDPETQLDGRLVAILTARAEMAAQIVPSVDDAIVALDRRTRGERGSLRRVFASVGIARTRGRFSDDEVHTPRPAHLLAWILIAVLALLALAGGSILVGTRPRLSIVPALPHRNGVIVVSQGTGFVAVDPSDGATIPFHASGGWLTWSPDGTKLASIHGGAVWIQNTVTGATVRVTSCCGGDTSRQQPEHDPVAWSPDGSHLAFADKGDLWTVRTDGSDRTQLTRFGGTADPIQPAWSPDGSRIAFAFGLSDNDKRAIDVIGADGTHLGTIVGPDPVVGGQPTVVPTSPAWSPDGSRIAFIEQGSGASLPWTHIETMRADGKDRHVVYVVSDCCLNSVGDVAWSPDGTKLAATATLDHHTLSLLVMNADGSHVVELLAPIAPGVPAWKPIP